MRVEAPVVRLPPLMASVPAVVAAAPLMELPMPVKVSVPGNEEVRAPAPERTPESVTDPAPLPATVVFAVSARLLPITTAAALF